MRLCVSSWSIHSLFLNNLVTAEGFPKLIRDHLGVGAIEYFEGDLCDDVLRCDEARFSQIAQACQDAGVRISSISARNDLTVPDDEAARQDAERLQRWIALAPTLGHHVIRINTGVRRPTRESLKRAQQRLRPLLTAAKRTGVALAVENHPHIVRHADDLKLLAEFVDELSGVGLRSCPDTGAFNPEIAHEGFATLARHAAHVHVKAPVQEQGKDALVDAYRPFVRALQSTKYKGHLSIEFLEVDDPNADSLEGTWRAARAIGKLIGEEIAPRPPRLDVLQPSRRIMGSPLRIAETSVAIIEDALPLMLEGCEHRLKDSPVRLRTFSKAGERDFGSPNCRTTNACSATECHIPLRECFCALVACESTGVQQCSRFYAEQFQRIKESSDPGPDVCLCPLGLAVLFVPIRTERDLYGAVVCGGWRESGTEGVIIYGIDRWLDCDAVKERVEEAILAIPYLTSGALRNAYQPELFTQSFSLRRAKREGTKGTEEDVRV